MKSLTTTLLHLWRPTPCTPHFHRLNILTNLCRLIKNNTTTKYFLLTVFIGYFNLPVYAQSCANGESEVVVRILTDGWGGETGWSLTDDDGGIYGIAPSNSYDSNYLYIDTICVPNNICINFTITDSAGDGICCDYGAGFYEIILNDSIIGSGGEFGSSESLRFYSTADGTTCPPIVEEVDCGDDESKVVVSILTDNHGFETGWSLEDDNGIVYKEVSSGTYSNDTLYLDTICVPKDICMNFIISDFEANGICCVNGEGIYKIILNDSIIGSGGEFTWFDSLRFYSTNGTTCVDPTYPTTNSQDSLELVNFYNATCGTGCTLDWDFNTYVSTWEGITVEDGRVTDISIDQKGLTGDLPNLNLPELTRLFLFGNQLNGEIPDFGSLPNLQYLILRSNQLSGSIPNFENLPNLWNLDLAYNMLSDSCFSDALLNLCAIGLYDFSNNPDLPGEGDFAAFCDNGFGSCTDTTFTSIDSLELIRLYEAACQGCSLVWDFYQPFDTWEGIYAVSGKVIEIDLNDKGLNGTLPDSLKLPFLTLLNLSQNQLSGEIPNFNGLLNLEGIYLFDNQLSGEIPNFNLPNLEDIFLGLPGIGGNQLSGEIPDFDSLPNLDFLSLSDNRLSGEIPNFDLPKLKFLWLGNNQLSDSIPDFNLPKLEEISLFNNQLSGEIPNFSGLPKLKDISFGNNQLSGQIPNFILPDLEFISLSENRLTDTVPSFQGAPKLEQIWLDDNQLSGSVPDFKHLDSLELLFFRINKLSGTIPNLENNKLYRLNLSYNEFSYDEIEDYLLNNALDEFRYSPQYYGEIQSYIVEPNISLTFELLPPFQSTNNNQYVSYQWKKNYNELAGSTDSTYTITNLQLNDVGKYNLHMTDASRIPDLEIISKPIYVYTKGFDLYGQPVIYNELMMEFDDWEDKTNYEEEFLYDNAGYIADSCSCNRLLYLWQFPNDTTALDVLLNISTRREKQKRKAKVDGGLNNVLSIGPITSGLGRTWSGDYSGSYPDSVLVYLLDSGLNTEHWNASPYLPKNAPLDNCYNIPASKGYDYIPLNTISGNFIDSLGHGTYGFRSIAEGLPDDMNIKVVPLKVFNKQGQGTLFDFICALYHAIDHEADIINVSAGYSGEPSEILKNAIALAQEKGQFIVTATGNDGVNIDSIPQYPAYYAAPDTLYTISQFTEQDTTIITHYDNVISVASLSPEDSLSDFSNYGQYAATMSAYGEDMAGYSHTGKKVSSSGSSVSAYYVTRELAVEIGKDNKRDYRQVWSDFEAERLRICPATEGLTSTGKCLDVTLEKICDSCSGSLSNDFISNYFVFPNPAKDELFITFDIKEQVDYGSIKLFNATGHLLLSEQLNMSKNNQLQLNINTIPPGVYFLGINAGGVILTHKIIKY